MMVMHHHILFCRFVVVLVVVVVLESLEGITVGGACHHPSSSFVPFDDAVLLGFFGIVSLTLDVVVPTQKCTHHGRETTWDSRLCEVYTAE
jgi:hypothetical protein